MHLKYLWAFVICTVAKSRRSKAPVCFPYNEIRLLSVCNNHLFHSFHIFIFFSASTWLIYYQTWHKRPLKEGSSSL